MIDHSHDHPSATEKTPELIVGIDLGTTNSLVAAIVDGHPQVLRSRDGRRLVPSVVSLVGGEIVVGDVAKKNKIRDSAHTIFSAKRLLGRGFADVSGSADQLPYRIVPEAGGAVKIQVEDRLFTAIEISAMILRELKRSAEEALGQPVRKAVITVPAYFNDAQRQDTRTAGRLAGLEVLRIVNEPTAAALAYGLQQKQEGVIAVYDLGGGTFDLSILKLHHGIFEVLATHGDTALGGDDLDRAVAEVVARESKEKHGIDAYADSMSLAALLEGAEDLKIALSTAERAVFRAMIQGRAIEREFTRAEFEGLIRPVLERTRIPCEQALRDAGLKVTDLTDVVVVGGPTRLPVVREVVRGIFGREPNVSLHPDEVVAVGAAIQADILSGRNQDFLLLDVVPLSLGIETYGGLMSTLIPRNTRIPASAREMFTTFVDHQTGVDVHVLQGERERVEDNRSLARFKLKGIEPAPAGFPRVEVTFLVDADGILQVAAKDLRTGHESSIEVRPSFGLSESEVERMLNAASDHALSDVEFKRWIEVRNQVEPVLRAAEKQLPDARRLLTHGEAQRIESLCRDIREAFEKKDPELAQTLKYELDQITVPLAEKVIQEALAGPKRT